MNLGPFSHSVRIDLWTNIGWMRMRLPILNLFGDSEFSYCVYFKTLKKSKIEKLVPSLQTPAYCLETFYKLPPFILSMLFGGDFFSATQKRTQNGENYIFIFLLKNNR